MILDDFAYFKHNSTYDEFSTNATLGIDPNTICFVEDTGIIYTHGHQFGGKIEYVGSDGITVLGNTIGLNETYIDSLIRDLIPEQKTYTEGTCILISNKNKISVDVDTLKELLGITNKDGEGSTDDPEITDQELLQRINNLQILINQLRQDLTDLHNENEDKIRDEVEDILSDAQWLKDNFPVGQIFSFGDIEEGLEQYLIGIGLIKENGNVGWSELIVNYNKLQADVTAVQQAIGEDGELNLEVLRSSLEEYVDGRITGLNLESKWTLLDRSNEILRWIMNGFRAKAGIDENGKYQNFAEMYADASGENGEAATSLVKTAIEYGVDGKIEAAKSEIGSQLNDQLDGFISQSTMDDAIATMFAENSATKTKAAILATVTGDDSTIDLIASKVNVTGTMVANAIQATDLTLSGNVTATNANIKGDIYANSLTLGSGSFAYNPTSVTLPTIEASSHREFFIVTQNNVPVVSAQNNIIYYDTTAGEMRTISANQFSWKKYTLYWLISDGNPSASEAKWFLIELSLAKGTERERVENFNATIYPEETAGGEWGAYVSAINDYDRPIIFYITATIDGVNVGYGYQLNPGEQLSTSNTGSGKIVGDGYMGRVNGHDSYATNVVVDAYYQI